MSTIPILTATQRLTYRDADGYRLAFWGFVQGELLTNDQRDAIEVWRKELGRMDRLERKDAEKSA